MRLSRFNSLPVALVWAIVPLAMTGSAEEPCTAHFEATGSFITGEGKSSWQDFPDLNDTPWLVDNLVRIVAEGGWQITTTSRDSGVVIGTQPVTGQPVPLNITVSPALPNGLRVQALIKSPGGIKVTDKEAKKVFCRVFQKVGQLRQSTNAATPAAPVPPPASGATTPKAEKPLANADIVALTVAGLPASVLVSKIQQAPSEQFDVSTDALVALSKQGVPKDAIEAMIKRVGSRK